VYLTLQAVRGLETLWQWPFEMYKAIPNVSHQSATGKGVITPSPPPAVAPAPSTEHLEPTGGPRPFQRSIPPFFTAIELFQDGTCTYPCFREGQGGRGKDNTETGGTIRHPPSDHPGRNSRPPAVPRAPPARICEVFGPVCASCASLAVFVGDGADSVVQSFPRLFAFFAAAGALWRAGRPVSRAVDTRYYGTWRGRRRRCVAVSLCRCVPVSLPVEGAVWPRSAPVGSLPSSLFPLLSSPTSDFRLPHAPRPRSAPLTRPRTPRSQPRTCRRSVPRRSGSSESTAPVMGPV